MDKLWLSALLNICQYGDNLSSRYGECKEYIGFSGSMSDIDQTLLQNKIRNMSSYYACAEFLWYLSQTDDTTFLQEFAPSYKNFTEDGIHAHGAYGSRWAEFDQLESLLEVLKDHPESRQAIVTMWNPTDFKHAILVDKKDLPCTISLQFLVRDKKLHLIATMRSNDVWLGMPYDVFCFTQLQRLIASTLGLSPGSYTHQVGSMHQYEKNYAKIDSILDTPRSIIEKDYLNLVSSCCKEVVDVGITEQAESCIKFVTNVLNCVSIDNMELEGFNTAISDCAYVCASKQDPKFIEYIYDPQLKGAVINE